MKVLEYKHRSPFVGCFWQWQYMLVDGEELVPIVATRPYPTKEHLGNLEDDYPFTDFRLFNWGDAHHEIPETWFPLFWQFAEQYGLEFWWMCFNGHWTNAMPCYPGYAKGNGGVGMEYGDWHCLDCSPQHQLPR